MRIGDDEKDDQSMGRCINLMNEKAAKDLLGLEEHGKQNTEHRNKEHSPKIPPGTEPVAEALPKTSPANAP